MGLVKSLRRLFNGQDVGIRPDPHLISPLQHLNLGRPRNRAERRAINRVTKLRKPRHTKKIL